MELIKSFYLNHFSTLLKTTLGLIKLFFHLFLNKKKNNFYLFSS